MKDHDVFIIDFIVINHFQPSLQISTAFKSQLKDLKFLQKG